MDIVEVVAKLWYTLFFLTPLLVGSSIVNEDNERHWIHKVAAGSVFVFTIYSCCILVVGIWEL